MLLGCISPGVGAGLYGFLVLAVVAVFVAGSWLDARQNISAKDRSPRNETRHAAVLIYPITVLGFSPRRLW